MANQPIKPGSWGDWAVIEHKPKDAHSCEACIHYCSDGSCSIYPVVIKEVGFNYWKLCDRYETDTQENSLQKRKQNHASSYTYQPKYCPECKFAEYSSDTKEFCCNHEKSPNYMKRCKQCLLYMPEQDRFKQKVEAVVRKNREVKIQKKKTNLRLCDIHSHVVFEIDDGTSTIEMAIEAVRSLTAKGVKNIVCTPHSWGKIENYQNNLLALKQTIKNEYPDVHLYKGCSVLCRKEKMAYIINCIKDGLLPTINGSRYLLLEFDEETKGEEILYCISQIRKLTGKDCILSHPELYHDIQRRTSFIKKIRKSHCLYQIDIANLVDGTDEAAMCLARFLLSERLVDFIGTNTYCGEDNALMVAKGLHYILDHCEASYIRKICEDNARALLFL